MELKNKNILVAGGAGFIGSHLCDSLIYKKNNVICADNYLRGNENNIKHLFDNDKFHFLKMDVSINQELDKIFNDYNIDYVFHLAANSDIQASAKAPQIEFKSTASTTWALLDAMRKYNCKNLFFASTSAVYGKQNYGLLSEETTPLYPISYYGSAKLASEAFISAFAKMNDMNALVFRFPNVIGNRLTHGVIFDFIAKLRSNPHELEVLGDGTQSKPYVHVSDLIKAIINVSSENKGLNIYNVGVDSETDVKSIAQFVCEGMNLKNVKINYGENNIGWKGDVPHFQYDLRKIWATGWKATMTSDEAVKQTIDEVLSCKA